MKCKECKREVLADAIKAVSLENLTWDCPDCGATNVLTEPKAHAELISAINAQTEAFKMSMIGDAKRQEEMLSNKEESAHRNVWAAACCAAIGKSTCGSVDDAIDCGDKVLEAFKKRFSPVHQDKPYIHVLEAKKGNVVQNKETGSKHVVNTEFELLTATEEIVCETPHADEDYSYLCGGDHCRCMQ
ncbi:MAG: hypothetical protein KAJ19_30060 [Gammaproteobacteria bacterium]|nr:hypothetical protein [Gammaproteobacteria bacterium]